MEGGREHAVSRGRPGCLRSIMNLSRYHCRYQGTMNIFYSIIACLLLAMAACKPVPQDTLTLLYTSDTLGQIEPCG